MPPKNHQVICAIVNQFGRLIVLIEGNDDAELEALGREFINAPGRMTREGRLYPESPQVIASQRNVAMCHEETQAPQHIASLFDHLVGKGEQRWRYNALWIAAGLSAS